MEVIFIFLGIVGAIVIFINPFIGLLATVALIPQALLPSVGSMFLGMFTMMTPIKIVGAVTVISTLLHHIFMRKSWKPIFNKVFVLYLIFFIYLLISGFAQPSSFSREDFTAFASFLFMGFSMLSLIDTPKKLRLVIWVTLISFFIVAIGSIIDYFSCGEVNARMGGATYGPNEFAIGLIPFLGLSFYGMFYEKNKMLRVFLFIIFLGLLSALIVTFSRGGYIGVAGIALFAILKSKKKIVTLLVLIVSVFIIANVVPKHMWDRFVNTRIEANSGVQDDGTVGSTRRRYYLALAAWQMFLDHPIFGVGPGNYYYKCHEYQPIYAGRAHNMYLEIMAEMGAIGIVLFVMVILSSFKSLKVVNKSSSNLRHYATGVTMGLIGFLIAALFLHAQQDKSFWLFIFLAMVLENLLKRERKAV